MLFLKRENLFVLCMKGDIVHFDGFHDFLYECFENFYFHLKKNLQNVF